MTAAPRPQAPGPRTHRRQDAQAIAAQLLAMFGDDEGWIETWRGESNPDKLSQIVLDTSPEAMGTGRRWHWYSRERRPAIVSHLLTWATSHGNVYISTALYDRPARPRHGGVPLPSRVLFVDDAPEQAPLAYSMVLSTSAHKRQSCYLLAEPVDVATRQDLQRRIAYALGADRSGHDIEQLGRVGASFNTKHGERYPVTLSYADGPRYSAQDLAARFPLVPGTQDTGAIEVDDRELAHWLGNVDAIMRRIRPGTPTYQTLHSDGGADRSKARWAMAHSLRKVWSLPSVEIAAMLLTFCDWGHTKENGSAWLYADVLRCIADAEANHPHAVTNPTRGAQARPCVTLPEVPRQPRGRRRMFDADEYYTWLCDNADSGNIIQTQAQIAIAYDASIATIRRLEAQLREQGLIKRHTSHDRHRSWVTLLGAITNTAGAPETAPETAPEVLSQIPRIIGTRVQEGEHTAPIAPPVPPALDDADPGDYWEQEPAAIDLPKRKRIKRRPLDTLTPAEQIAELKRRRGVLHGMMDLAKYRQNDSQYYALERQAGVLRERIEQLEAEHAAAMPPSPGAQLGLADAPLVTTGACVPPSPPVVVMSRSPLDVFAPPAGYAGAGPRAPAGAIAPTWEEVQAHQANLLEAQGEHARAAFIRRAARLPGTLQAPL